MAVAVRRWITTEADGQGMTHSRPLRDRCSVLVDGGNGGDGGWLYVKHKKHSMLGPGYPCGGSGGKGGDVIVKACSTHRGLAHVPGIVRADPGRPGRKRHVNGESGDNRIIRVPGGVFVRELIANEDPERLWDDTIPKFFPGPLLAELDGDGDEFVVAAGGRGGSGNNMASPHRALPGVSGEVRQIELELKMIADVGLIGMPNAGKSTLLGAVSRACPKIAPYPFTTVAPYIGRVDFVDGSTLSIADVPGLVEGAHQGIGLGFEFLRHLERTQVLLYVIDVARSEDPLADLFSLQREVAAYSPAMARTACGVVANKCDVAPHKTLPRVDDIFRVIRDPDKVENPPLFVRAVSARFGEGIKGLLQEVLRILQGRHEGLLGRPSEFRRTKFAGA